MLILKLCLTPLLILGASLAGRRWGSTVGGWIVGLPLTSGPVSVFLALDQGAAFAGQAAAGTLVGTAAQACFAAGYFWAACGGWPVAVATGAASYIAGATLLQALALPHLVLFAVAVAALAIGLRITPPPAVAQVSRLHPAWDIPLRMIVATALVVTVTAAAAALGPRLSGVAASFPIFAAVLAVFTQRGQGPAGGRLVVRGLMMGLFGFACFFATLGLLLTRTSLFAAFAAACGTCLIVQGASFVAMRRPATTPVQPERTFSRVPEP